MAQVARRRDRRLAACDLGNPPRQIVGAVMAAQQRHGDAAVFSDGDDGWLNAFVGQ